MIESLRAFDLVYITNGGSNGLQLLSAMITQQITGPGNRIGYGSALGVVLLVISLVPITLFLAQQFRKDKSHERRSDRRQGDRPACVAAARQARRPQRRRRTSS